MIFEKLMPMFWFCAFIYVCVFLAIACDLWSGVRKAKKRNEVRTSYGYKRTVDKIARYYNMLIVISIMDSMLIISNINSLFSLPVFPYLTLVGGLFLCFVELKSIFEKAEDKVRFESAGEAAGKILKDKDIATVLKSLYEFLEKSNKNGKD